MIETCRSVLSSERLSKILQLHFQSRGPFLAYDLRGMEERMKFLQDLSSRYHCYFLFASKSFPHERVLDLARRYLAGFDVSNEWEYEFIPGDLKEKTIWLTNPALNSLRRDKWQRENHQFIVSIETAKQLEILQELHQPPFYAIRLNACDLLDSASLSSHHRFGMRKSDLEGMKCWSESMRERFLGFHLHYASEKNTLDQYLRMAEESFKLARKVMPNLKVLNLGGGLHSLPLVQVELLLKQLREKIPQEIKLYFEPGRFISEDFGYACGQIQLNKNITSVGKLAETYVLDLSSLCHLQWSRPELVHFFPLGDGSGSRRKVRFYGPTCYENDLIGEFSLPVSQKDNEESIFKIGETIILKNISGYSYALNKGFNGIPAALVHFLE